MAGLKHFQPDAFEHLHLCADNALSWLDSVADTCPFELQLAGDALSPMEASKLPDTALNRCRLRGCGFIVKAAWSPERRWGLVRAVIVASQTPAGMLPIVVDFAAGIGIGLLPLASGRAPYPQTPSQIGL